MLKKLIAVVFLSIFISNLLHAQTGDGWYTEGEDNHPEQRIRVTVTNPLDIPLEQQPVVIKRSSLPIQNIPERWINIVDPNLEGRPEPTLQQLKEESGYLLREETNGRSIVEQVDDLDKDGVWDEIFFLTDLKPGETRDFYIYIGEYERGMYEHLVHANIANYGRHTVPLWESGHMGWKLWYPHAVDLHGNKEPMLTAYWEYSNNASGYYMPSEMGTDFMTVARTFGSGGMCLFENPYNVENPSRPDYSPYRNEGPIHDTRYAYDVVFNGPLRSRIKVTTRNWKSGNGFYEFEQYYTAVAHKSWSKVEVDFTKFLPSGSDVMFGAGMRKIMEEYRSINKDGYVISMGDDVEARIPDEDIGDEALVIPWMGIGLVVKEDYNPEYHSIENYGGNHVFKMPVTSDRSYEYMIAGAWSLGSVNNNEDEFVNYVETEALKYNNPPVVAVHEYEKKN